MQAAVRAYSSSLEGRTDDARVWANRSAAHLSAGNAAAALEDARIARTLDPAYVKVYPPCSAEVYCFEGSSKHDASERSGGI